MERYSRVIGAAVAQSAAQCHPLREGHRRLQGASIVQDGEPPVVARSPTDGGGGGQDKDAGGEGAQGGRLRGAASGGLDSGAALNAPKAA